MPEVQVGLRLKVVRHLLIYLQDFWLVVVGRRRVTRSNRAGDGSEQKGLMTVVPRLSAAKRFISWKSQDVFISW